MSNLVYRRQFPIEWGHCDPAGIVFNSRFFEFFDWSAWKLFEAALGVRPSDLAATFGIVGIPLVDAKANFMRPAKFNDTVEIALGNQQVRTGELRGAAPHFGRRRTGRRGHRNPRLGGAGPRGCDPPAAVPIPAEVIERFKVA